MTLERLQKRREELHETLKQAAIQMEQVRGALALCDELITEAQASMNGDAHAGT
jgi:hypothetical protein